MNQSVLPTDEDGPIWRTAGSVRVNVLTTDLEGKRLELLGELMSGSAPVGVLINPKGEYAEQACRAPHRLVKRRASVPPEPSAHLN